MSMEKSVAARTAILLAKILAVMFLVGFVLVVVVHNPLIRLLIASAVVVWLFKRGELRY